VLKFSLITKLSARTIKRAQEKLKAKDLSTKNACINIDIGGAIVKR